MTSIEEIVINRLKEKFGGNPTTEDHLGLMGMDSVGMAELTIELEKEFDVKVRDDIVEIHTVQELADYVRELQAQGSE